MNMDEIIIKEKDRKSIRSIPTIQLVILGFIAIFFIPSVFRYVDFGLSSALITGWVIASVLIAHLGSDKRIGWGETFIISLVLSPLVGALAACTSRHKDDIARDEFIAKTLSEIANNMDKMSK